METFWTERLGYFGDLDKLTSPKGDGNTLNEMNESIYWRQGLYTPETRRSLQDIIQFNKLAWQGIFEQGENS